MKITGEMHFAKALQELERSGVDMRAVTPGELYALAEASRRCADPFAAVNAELAGEPVQVGRGVWLWPLTIGAQVWLEEHAWRWWRTESRMGILAMAYAMRNARDPQAFEIATERWSATGRVLRSALSLPARLEELTAAICRANGIDPHALRLRDRARPSGGGARKDFASLVSRLEAESGLPRETWLWGRSLGYVLKAYGELHAFASAFAGKRREMDRMLDELNEAMTGLAKVKAGIFRRVTESAEREDQKDAAHGNGDDGDADGEVATPKTAGRAASGAPPTVVLDEQAAGQAHEEGVVGAGDSGGGVDIVHDGADCSISGGLKQ